MEKTAVREMTENIYYSVGLIISGIIIAYISNRRMHESHKSINLLLFLCFAAPEQYGAMDIIIRAKMIQRKYWKHI